MIVNGVLVGPVPQTIRWIPIGALKQPENYFVFIRALPK